ncbi:MAG: cytochrome-c peroxidase [Myxococcota bacterium]
MKLDYSHIFRGWPLAVLVVAAAACGDQGDTRPQDDGPAVDPATVEQELPALLEEAGAAPIELPAAHDPAKVELGRMLFFDPILSGNKDASCSVCHHPTKATTIEDSLSVGTKAIVEDGVRLPDNDHSFTPRNPPDLFNLGDPALETIFWDSRMEVLEDGRIAMHDRNAAFAEGNYLRVMPASTESLLAGQIMFPVLNRDELRGDYGEVDINGEPNELGQRTDIDFEGVWRDLTDRLMSNQTYRELFAEAFPSVSPEDMTFNFAANALAAFIIETFSFDDAPWDEYLRGDDDALTDQQKYGAWLFYGDAGCAECHSGKLMTDQKLHNIGVRPISSGPDSLHLDSEVAMDKGAAHRAHAGHDQAFTFRTPTLRNVALTAPYMHNGAYTDLEDVIRHKTAMHDQLWNYDYTQIGAQFWDQVHNSDYVMNAVEATMTDNQTRELTEEEIDALVAFLESLTSPSAAQMSGIEPEQVPSGLPIPEP